MKRLLIFLFAGAAILSSPMCMSAKKKGYRLQVEKATASDQEEENMAKGSFMVASQCEDCNNGYNIGQISFAGYDKPRNSAVETFFITNHTDRLMTGISLYIEYLTLDGRQLNKRYVRLSCHIPPGETRSVEVKSWDRQKAFHYEKSDAGKKGDSTPYTVVFDPIAFYLRF